MKIIISSNGYPIQVSDEDYDLNKDTWYVNPETKEVHRCERVVGRQITIIMARVILDRQGIECPDDADHKDRDPQNNQRENLRPATQSQSAMNQGLRSDNTSTFKGVTWHKIRQKWVARIQYNGHRKSLGYFDSAVGAAQAYDQAALQYHGKFAFLNFPD